MHSFEELRKEYPQFVYRGFDYDICDGIISISYDFEISGLEEFHPTWKIRYSDFIKDIADAHEYNELLKQDDTLKRMIFALGMAELVSYWKITCAPRVIVYAGHIDEKQENWWKELYFNGLGEFFYRNGIDTSFESFMSIESDCKEADEHIAGGQSFIGERLNGALIPVGGGKDSIVSIKLLKQSDLKTKCFILNPRGATVNTTVVGGYGEEDVVVAKRTLDQNMLRLNSEGYLNGHTPFSAIVAFSSVIAAYVNGLEYVVLSNESSANESTVKGSTVNHQYSKSFKFEQDFKNYEETYIGSNVKYFSLLRPLSEYQIAKYFAKCTDYHRIFRSCNVGSKKDIWCGHCAKCLFVCFILSPFLSQDYLKEIFGVDMLNDDEMIFIMNQLIGLEDEKPFECVGSRDEINLAICQTIDKLKAEGRKLPLLLNKYIEEGFYERYGGQPDTFSSYYNAENYVPQPLLDIVIKNCIDR
ncbi:MAG: hypothetical protein IJM37_05190 [Lachnospiraceae bacterium]|nr:hypothetical protein [Lachnospiraceae bacterium]